MVAKTDQKARLLDLTTSVLELVRDGKRDSGAVCDVLQLIKNKPNFASLLLERSSSVAPAENQDQSLKALLRDWSKFYHQYFGIQPDFSGLMIPPRPEGFDFLIVVLKGITSNRIVTAMRQAGIQVSLYTENLDSIKSDRDSTQTYAIWVRNRQEADEELKNLSVNKIQEMGLKTETLPERLLHGFKFWDESHIHLDVRNITLCAGSRDSYGNVPVVNWDVSKVRVCWYFPADASVFLRARSAV